MNKETKKFIDKCLKDLSFLESSNEYNSNKIQREVGRVAISMTKQFIINKANEFGYKVGETTNEED